MQRDRTERNLGMLTEEDNITFEDQKKKESKSY